MRKFISILLIGMACSNFPFLLTGMILGFPAVVLNTFILSYVYRKELGIDWGGRK